MPLQTPRYSSEPNCEVYHNHTGCTESNNIEKKYFTWGTGNKRLCKHCEKLGDTDGMTEKFKEHNNLNALKNGIGGMRGVSSMFEIMKGRKM